MFGDSAIDFLCFFIAKMYFFISRYKTQLLIESPVVVQKINDDHGEGI